MTILSLSTLETWLWDSANILRGSIDSSDFKNYIFGLLFLKRANDVYDEEVESIMNQENLSQKDAEDEPYFRIPEEARWALLTAKTENIGEALDKAFAAIERDNTQLEGVMTAIKFGDKEKLSDAVLQRLLRHFNQYSLRNSELYTPDVLGDAYEYLIKMFADDAGKKGGEFYSPKGVVQLIVRLIKPQPKNRVYDPTSGSGGMLIESAKYVAEQPNGKIGNNINISLYGQEKNLGTWAICKINMILHNFMDADIRKGDTLTDPKHKDDRNNLMLFDRVIANPPFSQDRWWEVVETNLEKKLDKDGKEVEIAPNYNKVVVDKFGRFQYGIPPRGYADLAFLQHMVAVLKEDGKMGIILPHGTLFRGGTEGAIRQKLLEKDIIEGIIGLPSALFYNTGIPASIWIINKSKPDRLKNKVLFVDSSRDYKEGKVQNQLEEIHIDKVIDSYNAETDIDKFMRVVDMSEIKENDYNLNISRYISSNEAEVEINLSMVLEKIAQLEEKERIIDEKLNQLLLELGL
jgi:type I restriction enzyme M protein